MKRRTLIAAVVAVFVVSCIYALAKVSDVPDSRPAAAHNPGLSEAIRKGKPIGDGTYKVGRDIAPGTYRTEGPTSESIGYCYWARLADASGKLSAIIANGNAAGPAYVTLKRGEYFETNACHTWTKIK
jgi:hypothetical protein